MVKKILIFSTAYFPLVGGAEVAVKEITDRIGNEKFSAGGGSAFGWDMITLHLDKKSPKEEKMGNINVYRISGPKFLFPFAAFLKARELHEKNNYSAIWAIMASYAGFAALFFKMANQKIPYLLTLQEGDPIPEIKKKVRFIYPLFRRIFTKADFVQAISNYLGEWAREMGFKGPLEIVPNGVNTAHFSGEYSEDELFLFRKELASPPRASIYKNNNEPTAPPALASQSDVGRGSPRVGEASSFLQNGDKILITVSRLVEKNAVGDIIEAMKYLPENIKLLIAGTGPLKNKYSLLVTRYGLRNRVLFLGHVGHEELPKYLAEADVFIRPSLSEGLGNVFLEAMAAGLPVIATPVGGIPDFLKDGETGLFCEVGNPKTIAEKVKIYLRNEELREKIKANAKEMVEQNYDWNLIAQKMENIFNKLII